MDRKAIAKQTLEILKRGYYFWEDEKVVIEPMHGDSIKNSWYIPPEECVTSETVSVNSNASCEITIVPYSTVWAILDAHKKEKKKVGVLNFASAKNPGGGFINGAMAQEESLAASGGLYEVQTAHWEYYETNRNTNSMIYTDGAIYGQDVVFFRDERFKLLKTPVLASVLTLPAVNYGQVLLKGEDPKQAQIAMKNRMRRCLQIFQKEGDKNLILGAYGCGVFRNSPEDVAGWWKELLEEGYQKCFESICFAVFDRSEKKECLNTFETYFQS